MFKHVLINSKKKKKNEDLFACKDFFFNIHVLGVLYLRPGLVTALITDNKFIKKKIIKFGDETF